MARGRGPGKGKGATDALIATMTDLVGDVKGAVDPLSKRVSKEIRRLEKRLLTARATEARRLRQLLAAQGSRKQKAVAKRTRQAAEATGDVAALAAKLVSLAGTTGTAAEPASTPARSRRAVTPTPRTTTSAPRKRPPPADGSAGDTST